MRSETSPSISDTTPPDISRQTELQYCAALFSEEVAHELASPVCFLETIIESLRLGAAIDPDDIALAAEAVTRLRRLTAGLRSVRPPRPSPARVSLAELANAARARSPDERMSWTFALDEAAVVAGDRVMLERIVEAMLEAALAHVQGAGTAHVSTATSPAGTTFSVVASSRAGVSPASLTPVVPLQPWIATAAQLPLLVARRMARAHRLRLTFDASEGQISLCLLVPEQEQTATLSEVRS